MTQDDQGTVYVCVECGSPDLLVTAWVHMNQGGEVGQAPTEQVWCPVCETDAADYAEQGGTQ